MNPNDLKIIILDNPLSQLSDPLVQILFGKCLNLRIRCFRSQYPDGTLPFDTTDFFATHFLIGKGGINDFSPILAFRQVNLSRCERYRCAFPPLALAKLIHADKHVTVLEAILANAKAKKNEISYIGSLVMEPEKKWVEETPKQYLLDLFFVVQYLFAVENRISEGIVGTTLKFKTDRFARFMGYKPLSLGGTVLEPLAVPFVHDDLSQFHHRTEFSKEAIRLAAQLQPVWKDVIYFGEEEPYLQKAA